MRHQLAMATVLILAISTVVPRGQEPADSIHVIVLGRDRAPVRNLLIQDFEVTLDGIAIEIESITPAPPISAVVLLDVTWSATEFGWPWTETVRSFEQQFLPRLTSSDRIRVGGISRRLSLAPAFTNDRDLILGGVRGVLTLPAEDRTGPSPIWDAVGMTAQVLSAEPGRRNLLLVTDGIATGNYISSTDALQQATLANVTIHVVVSGFLEPYLEQARDRVSDAMVEELSRPRIALEHLARATGGLYLIGNPILSTVPGACRALGTCLREIVDALHGAYTIRFTAPNPPGQILAVDVRVPGRDDLQVHVRQWHRTAKIN